MAGRRLLYSGAAVGSDMNNVLLQNKRPPSDSPFLSCSSSFLGSRSMFSFGDVSVRNHSDKSFFRSFDQDENGDEDEDYDEYFHQPEKKRRLKADQIQFLEKSFEADNKLEPERKIQLAKDLGLQPRQVAIWFQNRRARWKTKTLERDYNVLQESYNGLKADYDNLLKEKEKLKAEVLDLTDKLLLKEKEKGDLKLFDKQILFEAPRQEHIASESSELIVSKDSVVDFKQEDLNSVKSDVIDSDSPYYTDGIHSSLLEPGDSSYVLEPDQSDMSQDEEVNFSKNLLPSLAYIFPTIGDNNYSDPPANSCYFGFPIEEDQPFGFWAY